MIALLGSLFFADYSFPNKFISFLKFILFQISSNAGCYIKSNDSKSFQFLVLFQVQINFDFRFLLCCLNIDWVVENLCLISMPRIACLALNIVIQFI